MTGTTRFLHAVPWALLLICCDVAAGVRLQCHFSAQGIHGQVTFLQEDPADNVTVMINLQDTHSYVLLDAPQEEKQYSWSVWEFPVDYTKKVKCRGDVLGKKILDLSALIKPIIIPTNGTIQLQTNAVRLRGTSSIWGHSLVLEGPKKACASVLGADEVKTAEARFVRKVAGSVWFRSLGTGDLIDTTIYSSLYHVSEDRPVSSDHRWQIYITDILESEADKQRDLCTALQILYDPDSRVDADCSKDRPEKCKVGDLGRKLGLIRVGSRESRFSKKIFSDPTLVLPELSGPRNLYLIIFDKDHPDSFYSCARIRPVEPQTARALFNTEGVQGNISFFQRSPFDPTTTSVTMTGLKQQAGGFHIHLFPVPPRLTKEDTLCARTGGHYNPENLDMRQSPSAGLGTRDQYETGDLSGKYGTLSGLNDINKSYIDTNLPLFGPNSITGRSVVIHKGHGTRWICAGIETTVPIISAAARFAYPIVGRIIFSQPRDDQFADTTVFVEYLLYSDGNKNDTSNHRWHVHVGIPDNDYYGWQNRCRSAGGHYNPYNVSLEQSSYSSCSSTNHLRCEVGDLVTKHERLSVGGTKERKTWTKRFFTDTNLPLSGPKSIVGKSIVIHDDNAPRHRGDRMACTGIQRLHRLKAVAKDWFYNMEPHSVTGKLEFVQENEYSPTNTEVKLEGLSKLASGYHVHQAAVPIHLQFPCTNEEVGGHYNPYKVEMNSQPTGTGTPDQYEAGDLSGKYGSFQDINEVNKHYNDTNLQLFGPNSILGRSIVIHKKEKMARWACATVGRGFSPSEAEEIRAIASFHHPNGFAWGYIRMTQLRYYDGSLSETTMQVVLKHPGKNDRNVTHNHNWGVFVNPVGHDAAVKHFNARCVSSGHRWNPQHSQLAHPNDHDFYREQCGPDNPLRCEVGDLSGKHGPITVGEKKYVFTDPNLPLYGAYHLSAVGKAIVILNKDRGSEKYACANIETDHDIVKYASIRKPPNFILSKFIEDVRNVMAVPEWMLLVDTRNTKVIQNGKCIEIQLHFTGPHAHKLEQDFTHLLSLSRLDRPSIQSPGAQPNPGRKSRLSYKACGSYSIDNKHNNGHLTVRISVLVTLLSVTLVTVLQ